MKRRLLLAAILFFTTACSRLPKLTSEILLENERKWAAHKPDFYRLVLEMSGDRVESGRFEVEVRLGQIRSLRRNSLIISSSAGQDYTMEGLFHMLAQELSLAEKPATLGAPPGYAVYTTASFDSTTGHLIRFRRNVGGAANAIEVFVREYEARTVVGGSGRLQSSRP